MTSSFVFGDYAKIESGYAFKSTEWLSNGVPVVKIRNIKDGVVNLEDCDFVSEDVAKRAADFRAQGGDILISLTGYVGQVGRVLPSDEVLVNQRVGFVRPKYPDELDYIYYLLRFLRQQIEELGTGTAQANVAPKDIMNLSIPDVSNESRTLIGRLLGNLDKKIAVNNELSKSLEGIAQTIFKSWFIDFDPVKAKMAGEKLVGMDAATAALFPDSMEESELGSIPKGWNVRASTEMFEIISGGTPKTSNEDYWGGEIPWFSVVDAPDSGGCFFIKTAKTITEEGLANSAARLVRQGVTVISARGTVGKTAIVAVPSTFNQSCYGIEGKYGDFFTYLLLQNQIVRLQNISHGGMFDTITRDTFSAIKVAKPQTEIIKNFESLVSPIFLEIRSLQFQSHNLARIRDSLLPRLISGELQIPEEMLAS